MRKIREILRLTLREGLSRRQAAAATGVPASTVADQLARARRAGVGWPCLRTWTTPTRGRLFAPAPLPAGAVAPDWTEIHRELRRPGVTLQLLHMEFKERHPDGYQYTQFCRLYRAWQGHLDLVMRQEHRAGEKLFVDFAGQTIPIVDPATGEITEAQLFVAVLGASNYTYAEALPSQELPHWIAAHVHAFTLEGCTGSWSATTCARASAGRTAGRANRTYEEMAAHFGCSVIPGRPGSRG
jgi:transposase